MTVSVTPTHRPTLPSSCLIFGSFVWRCMIPGSISFAEYCEWLVSIGTVKVRVLTEAMVIGAKSHQLRGAQGLHPAILPDSAKK